MASVIRRFDSLPQPEPGLTEAVLVERAAALRPRLREQQADFNRSCVGLTLPVLITGAGRHPGQIAGRSLYAQPVVVDSTAPLTGEVHTVKITYANPNSLLGTLTTTKETIAA